MKKKKFVPNCGDKVSPTVATPLSASLGQLNNDIEMLHEDIASLEVNLEMILASNHSALGGAVNQEKACSDSSPLLDKLRTLSAGVQLARQNILRIATRIDV